MFLIPDTWVDASGKLRRGVRVHVSSFPWQRVRDGDTERKIDPASSAASDTSGSEYIFAQIELEPFILFVILSVRLKFGPAQPACQFQACWHPVNKPQNIILSQETYWLTLEGFTEKLQLH